jgi:trehalose/maltose transport system substrate-binding protein
MEIGMKKSLTIFLLFAITYTGICSSKPITINCYTLGGSLEYKATQDAIKIFEKENPKIKVNITRTPTDSTTDSTLQYFLQLFEAKSGDMDVLILDAPWAYSLASNLVDLTPYVTKDRLDEYLPVLLNCFIDNKKIVALPWYSDVGLIYYRKDLLKKYKLEIPKTWAELTKAAYIIQNEERNAGKIDFVGFVWQGKAYEGLTCDAVEWVGSNNGGTFINDKKVTIDNPNAIQALRMATNWIDSISPKGVLDMNEQSSYYVFGAGQAAFIRSWPYLYKVLETPGSAVKDKIGVTVIPAGPKGKSACVIGAWGIGVNKYTKHEKEAVELTLFLTSKRVQKLRAVAAGNAPNIMSLYKDKEVLKKNPEFKVVYEGLINGITRPHDRKYNQITKAIYTEVYSILKKDISVEDGVNNLAKKLSSITGYPIVK